MRTQNVKIRLGEKEKELIYFIEQHGKAVWKEDIINNFVHADKYYYVIKERLINLEKKGLIEMREEINPKTGRKKQKVYLKE